MFDTLKSLMDEKKEGLHLIGNTYFFIHKGFVKPFELIDFSKEEILLIDKKDKAFIERIESIAKKDIDSHIKKTLIGNNP